tara:strand:- start:4284 stop:6560 length:2277 start_codon:yes stop_codon:yes gene_type:complete
MALDSNKIADNFIDQIKQGSSPIPKQDNTVIVNDDSDPSAVGGLAALGATVIGATALGRRIPGIKSFLRPFGKTPKTNTTYTPNKAVEEIGDIPTATGQSSELILAPGKELAKVGRSRIGEVQNIPFTQGKGYRDTNPLVGSSTFDRVMEAPFDKGTAKQWTDWLTKANRADLKVSTGPLAGVSRRVTPDELEELNLIKFDKQGKGVDGFLKVMDDQNIPIDRDTLLSMVRNSPINSLQTLRFGVRGDPEAEMLDVFTQFKTASNKIPNKTTLTDELSGDISSDLRMIVNNLENQQGVIGSSNYTAVQDKLIKLGREVDNPQDFSGILQSFNKSVGDYNKYGKQIELPAPIKFRRDKSRNSGYFPAYKSQTSYAVQAGENYTEDVVYFAKAVPNVKGGRFKNIDSPHYVDNEIGFIRYDDLPNPKLGSRHLRVSEAQTDVHSPQFSSSQSTRESYFSSKKNPFNTDGAVKILKKQRDELLEKRAPYEELGRGIAGLTRSQRQELARVNYEIGQLEKSGMSKLLQGSQIEETTAAPLSKSWPDYVAKSMLRTMAERNINALSIVPSSMNKGIKMPGGTSKLGDEINYGLMDGKAVIRDANGRLKKTSQLATMVAPLKKLANQYGAKFEIAPMPKSNPDKPFKIIKEVTMKGSDDVVRLGRKHYNKKIGDKYIFEDHVGAARTLDEAEDLLKIRDKDNFGESGSIRYVIKEIGAENPDLYEMVPTFIASDDVLKKFLLPMKAYMNVGGFVDKTNIFKGLL